METAFGDGGASKPRGSHSCRMGTLELEMDQRHGDEAAAEQSGSVRAQHQQKHQRAQQQQQRWYSGSLITRLKINRLAAAPSPARRFGIACLH